MADAKQLDERLASRIERSPQGNFTHELWRRLNETGGRATRSEVALRLLSLERAGVVDIASRRWKRAQQQAPSEEIIAAEAAEKSAIVLNAIPVEVRAAVAVRPTRTDIPAGRLEPSWAVMRQLALHYAECLRLAGGSRLTQVPERHGQQFVLLAPDRPSWWPAESAGAHLKLNAAPPGLLQAFYSRRGYPVYLGYPLSVVRTRDGERFIRPVGLIECSWAVQASSIVVTAESPIPLLNPDWLSGLRRNRRLAEIMAWLGTTADAGDDGLASIRAGDWANVPGMAQTLGLFLASELRARLDPFRPTTQLQLDETGGVYNSVALFLPDVNRYTGRARNDLVALAELDEHVLADLALSAVFGLGGPVSDLIPVMPPLPLGEDQVVAARDLLAGPLTVISGPPGTGKSQVVAAIIVSAALAGRSALFASRTHQALDAVEQRVRELLPDRVLLARARAPDREREFNFARAVGAILAKARESSAQLRLDAVLALLQELERRLWATLLAAEELDRATARVAAIEVELAGPVPPEEALRSEEPRSWPRRVLGSILAYLRRLGGRIPPSDAVRVRLRAALAKAEIDHRAARTALDEARAVAPIDITLNELQRQVRALLPLLADALEAVSVEDRPRLAALAGELGLAPDAEAVLSLWRENADLVLRHFPLWAVTTLSAGGRIPLVPNLFDYVIFDEAATCDIGSALPLLLRAKRAVIVGDKMQTGLIVDLEPRRELEMLERAGLRRPGIGRFAFTQASLYDVASGSPSARHHILRDHYRCSSEIAEYISDTFYGRRLNVVTDEARLRPPQGVRPGLHWTHVDGPIERAGTGCVAPAEAESIVDHLVRLLEAEGYGGKVGVVTPFARQAERILRLCDGRLSRAAIDRVQLRVATSHSFQGDARDVILISPCYGPDIPQGAAWFLRDQVELFNVAVSRARAVCHVFGNLEAARRSSIPHLAQLANRIGRPRYEPLFDDRFDSPWERRLYEALAGHGIEAMPQYPLAGRQLDLAIVKGGVQLDIEVDGDAWHRDPDGFRKVSDLWRDHLVRSLGWRVLRFWVYELRDDMEECIDRVVRELG